MNAETETHPFRPAKADNGESTLACRACGEWWDSPNHLTPRQFAWAYGYSVDEAADYLARRFERENDPLHNDGFEAFQASEGGPATENIDGDEVIR